MKELDSFTVERLEEFIRQPLENGLTRSEQMELARIVLAAKRAEPVGYVAPEALRYKNFDNVIMIEKASGRRSMPLYTTPQLNSPEIPDGWKLVPIETSIEMRQAFHAAYEDFENGIGTCPDTPYQAMLAAAPEKP
ncbi:TPA: hypothetical protein ACJ2UI_003469 [Yersinia enterocolitica]